MKRIERIWQRHTTSTRVTPADQEKYRNEYFNPDECQFEVFGFYERLVHAVTHKGLGTRRIEKPDRPLGSDGMLTYKITENTILQRGPNDFLLKASPTRPVEVIGILGVLCGREKEKAS